MADLLSLLLTNPHGLGDSPLPFIPNQGEIRNADDPYYGTGGPSMPAKLAYVLSGIPGALEGIKGAREASLEGDPVRTAGNVAQTALAALPGAGRAGEALVSTAPRLAAMLTAGTLAPMAASGALSPSRAEAADANPLPGLYADRARLSQQIDAATRARDLEGQSGRGPKWSAADAEVQRLVSQQAGLDQMIRTNEANNSPEHQQDLIQRQKQIDDANAKAELDKPFQARHPDIATGLAIGAPIASGVLAATGLGRVAMKGKSLMAELLAARESGDVGKMAETAARLDQWQKTAPLKQAASIAVPATMPADARVLGDVIDKYSLPDTSKAQQDASKRLGDPVQYAKDAIPALASGLVWGGVGSKLAPSAPRGDAKAMLSLYGGKDAATLSDLLKSQATASRDVQKPIGEFQSALATRKAAVDAADQRNQQLGSGAQLVQEAADADLKQLPPPSEHHSHLQPRKKGRFSGPPVSPDND